MTSDELWKRFCAESKTDEKTEYDAWAFGDDSDALAGLVISGNKTATASGYDLYFVPGEEETLPKPGEYSVILNSDEEAVCVIRTVKTEVMPFDEVTEKHAFKEGEGDRSLAYWRKVHDDFFMKDYANSGLVFTHKSKILCEEFELLYVAPDMIDNRKTL